jgi:hypothetical protein
MRGGGMLVRLQCVLPQPGLWCCKHGLAQARAPAHPSCCRISPVARNPRTGETLRYLHTGTTATVLARKVRKSNLGGRGVVGGQRWVETQRAPLASALLCPLAAALLPSRRRGCDCPHALHERTIRDSSSARWSRVKVIRSSSSPRRKVKHRHSPPGAPLPLTLAARAPLLLLTAS